MDKIPLIVIAGATASGKTALSVELAKKFNCEIISADSMQIYKYMDIGTAKPTKEEMGGIAHHMIDIVEPDVKYSVAAYCEEAHKAAEDIYSKGKIPLVVGGTGLYINSLVNDVDFEDNEDDSGIREELARFAKEKGSEALHDILKECDIKSAQAIHPNNVKRVIRAIEVFKLTGKKLSEHNAESKLKESRYLPVMMEISWDRAVLYERINKRVDKMLDCGLEEEVLKLYKMGYDKSLTSMQGIGYKEMFEYFDGKCTLIEATDKIKQASRNYAKRQNTWFKRDERIIKINPSGDILSQGEEAVKEKLSL